MYDVIVIGAGPAGLYLARRLAHDGFDALVLEEHARPGTPVHCTGILASEAFDEFDIPSGCILNKLRKVRFVSPSGERFEYATDQADAVAIDRSGFDFELSLRAEREGARIRPDSRVRSIETDPASASVELVSGERLRARSLVLACGANYTFQRKLGLGVPPVYLQTAQVEAPAASAADPEEPEVQMFFGRNVAPSGFAWTVRVDRPDGPHFRVGLMCETNADHYFGRFYDRIVRSGLIAGDLAAPPRRKILPLGPIARTYGPRMLVIGDAAGIVKPTTGGGIYYSLKSAVLAGEVLAEGLGADRLDERFLSAYQRRWRRVADEEIRLQLEFRRLAERLDDGDIEGLFELTGTSGLLPLVRKTAQFNRHRDLILALLKHPKVRRVFRRELVS